MKHLSSLKQKDLADKIILVRVDLNIESSHNWRVDAIIPTLKFLSKNKAKTVLLSHKGRPDSGINPAKQKPDLSLKQFAPVISKKSGQPVHFIAPQKNFPFSPEDKEKITKARPGSIFLLENLRFFKDEEKNEAAFGKNLAGLGNLYVNDAFAVSHRANASVSAITKFIPSYCGLLLEKEIKNLDSVRKNPKKPLLVILGGAKISDKIGLIKNFEKQADAFLIGGAMGNTFIRAQGLPVGNSLHEKKMVPIAKKLLKIRKLKTPLDVTVENREMNDIGPQTIKHYSQVIRKAGTIIWNGPLGYIENKKFAKGTQAIAKAVSSSRAFSVIGGGETLLAFSNIKVPENVFLSTGGGAMLEYLSGKKLPGITSLK